MSKVKSPFWLEQRDHALALWNQVPPLPARRIAEILGVTKNAFLGAAHRFEFPARPSPIKPPVADSAKKPRRVHRAGKVTLDASKGQVTLVPSQSVRVTALPGALLATGLNGSPPKAEQIYATKVWAEKTVGWDRFTKSDRNSFVPKIAVYVPRAPRHAAIARKPGEPCCFPIGEPRTPGFRFCGLPSVTKRGPYCASCAAQAFAAPREGAVP